MKSSWSQGKDCGWKEKWNIRKASSTGVVIGAMEKMTVKSHATVSPTWVPHFTHISTFFVTQCKYGPCGSFWEACLLSVSWAYYSILTAHFCSWTSQRGSLEKNIYTYTFYSKPFWGDGTQSPMHSRQTLYHQAISAALFSVFHSLAASPPFNVSLTPSFSRPPVRLKVTINGCKDRIGQQSFFHMLLYAGQVRVL